MHPWHLFLTDGVDTTSFFDAARVLDTMKYATGQTSVVLVRGGYSNLTEGPMLDLLKKITATGGGQIVTLNPGDELKAAFLAAVEEFRTSYQLRYAPAGPARPGWHTVVVTVPNRTLTVRARLGYWVP